MKTSIVLVKGRPGAARACAFLEALQKDKAWCVTVEEYRPRRSDSQNRALFGLAYKTLAEFMGLRGAQDIEQLHESMCRLYFGEVEREIMGKVVTRPKRTTTTNEAGNRDLLNTTDFSDFFSFVQQKASSIGCFIDDPDPEYFMREAVVRPPGTPPA